MDEVWWATSTEYDLLKRLEPELPPTSYLLPPTAYLLPPTAYLLPPTAHRPPPTSYRYAPLEKNMGDVRMHLTNYAINKDSDAFVQPEDENDCEDAHKRTVRKKK